MHILSKRMKLAPGNNHRCNHHNSVVKPFDNFFFPFHLARGRDSYFIVLDLGANRLLQPISHGDKLEALFSGSCPWKTSRGPAAWRRLRFSLGRISFGYLSHEVILAFLVFLFCDLCDCSSEQYHFFFLVGRIKLRTFRLLYDCLVSLVPTAL